MRAIAYRSRQLTRYLEILLDGVETSLARDSNNRPQDSKLWTMLTPRDSAHRGAMLSFRWHDVGMLEKVVQRLKEACVIVDVRKPDIMRVAPSPLYSSFEDVWHVVQELGKAVSVLRLHQD